MNKKPHNTYTFEYEIYNSSLTVLISMGAGNEGATNRLES